jgi:hypothetical protein
LVQAVAAAAVVEDEEHVGPGGETLNPKDPKKTQNPKTLKP